MDLKQIQTILDKRLEFWYIPEIKEWRCSFQNCEIEKGIGLLSVYGIGNTIHESACNYLTLIKGKTAVLDSLCPSKRKEIKIPQ